MCMYVCVLLWVSHLKFLGHHIGQHSVGYGTKQATLISQGVRKTCISCSCYIRVVGGWLQLCFAPKLRMKVRPGYASLTVED